MARARLIYAQGAEKASADILLAPGCWWVQSTLQSSCSRLLLSNEQVFLINTSLEHLAIECHLIVQGLRANKGLILKLQVLFLSRFTQERRDPGFNSPQF